LLRAEQERKGQPLSTEDLMIAAHALSLGLTLVTHDAAFSSIDGLKTEDWTARIGRRFSWRDRQAARTCPALRRKLSTKNGRKILNCSTFKGMKETDPCVRNTELR